MSLEQCKVSIAKEKLSTGITVFVAKSETFQIASQGKSLKKPEKTLKKPLICIVKK